MAKNFAWNNIDPDNVNEGIPNGLLQLYNVEIAGNEANEYGGALAACPTANVKIYVTNGAVLYDNLTRTGSAQDVYIAESKDETSLSYVSDFMLGGGMYQWLWGNSKDNIRAEQSQYQYSAKEIKVSGLCDETDVEKAVKLAQVHITKNQALSGSGGGIASNGDVIIGTAPEKQNLTVKITKSWDKNGYENEEEYRPDFIKVDIRIGTYTLRAIELTKKNNWTATWENMPEDLWDSENSSEVEILEIGSDQYEIDKESVTAKIDDDGVLQISFENVYKPTSGNLTVSKTVSGSGADKLKDFTFTVTLDDKTLSGEYGDMTFENGVANFTLKHGESKTAQGLPAGMKYTVTESNNSGYTVTSKVDGEDKEEAAGKIPATILPLSYSTMIKEALAAEAVVDLSTPA